MRGILLQDEGMVHTVRLSSSSAYLDIVRETCLTGQYVDPIIADALSYSHRSIESPSDFIVLFQPWATSQDFWQPKLANSALHVPDLALSGGRSFDPLRGLSADTTYHISMSERLWCPLVWLYVERGGDGLSDAGVQRRGPAWNDKRMLYMVPSRRPVSCVACRRANDGGGMVSQRGSHV